MLLFNQKFPLRVRSLPILEICPFKIMSTSLIFFQLRTQPSVDILFLCRLNSADSSFRIFCVNCFKFHEQPVIEVFPWRLFAQTSLTMRTSEILSTWKFSHTRYNWKTQFYRMQFELQNKVLSDFVYIWNPRPAKHIS